jgi:hypothetical protein
MKTLQFRAAGYVAKLSAAAVFMAIPVGVAMAQLTPTTPPGQPAPPPTPTYKNLMDQGFEIKSTIYLSDAASTRLATVVQPETVIVTLQKGPLTATCWIQLGDWQRQTVSTLSCNLLQ